MSIVKDLKEYIPQGDGYNSHFARTLTAAVEEIETLHKLLDEAADDISDWGSYASDYFKEKHDLAGCVAKYRLKPNGGVQAPCVASCARSPGTKC